MFVALADRDTSTALVHAERAMGLFAPDRPEALNPHYYGCLAIAMALEGRHDEAETAARRGIELARTTDLGTMRCLSLLRGATSAAIAEDWPTAGDRIGEILPLLRRMGTRRRVRDTLHIAALVVSATGRPEDVVPLLDAADLHEGHNETPGGTLPAIADAGAEIPRRRPCLRATGARSRHDPRSAAHGLDAFRVELFRLLGRTADGGHPDPAVGSVDGSTGIVAIGTT